MPNDTAPESAISDPAQPWMETISGLEEEIRNLRRLHLTIERNNQLFEALLSSSRDGITLTRLDGTIIRVVRPILGYATATSGLSLYDFVCPDDWEELRSAYRRLGERGEQQMELEFRMRRPDGSFPWVESTITDMLDNPAVQAIVLNYRNVTRLKLSEFRAAECEAVVGFAPFAVFSTNTAGEILSWNARAGELFGYPRDEILGRHVRMLVPPEGREEELRRRSSVMEQKIATGKVRTVGLRKDGAALPMEVLLSPIIVHGRVRGIAQLSLSLAPAS